MFYTSGFKRRDSIYKRKILTPHTIIILYLFFQGIYLKITDKPFLIVWSYNPPSFFYTVTSR